MTNKDYIISVRLNEKSYSHIKHMQEHLQKGMDVEVPLGAVVRHMIDHMITFHEQRGHRGGERGGLNSHWGEGHTHGDHTYGDDDEGNIGSMVGDFINKMIDYHYSHKSDRFDRRHDRWSRWAHKHGNDRNHDRGERGNARGTRHDDDKNNADRTHPSMDKYKDNFKEFIESYKKQDQEPQEEK